VPDRDFTIHRLVESQRKLKAIRQQNQCKMPVSEANKRDSLLKDLDIKRVQKPWVELTKEFHSIYF